MRASRSLLAISACLAALAIAATITAAQSAPVRAPSAKPQRIMSASLCTDLLLLMLVPRQRISSITHLAHDAVDVLMPGADRGVGINHGTAEDVVRDAPDLILASPWATGTMRRLAAKVGAPVVEVDSGNSFVEIRAMTLRVGALVGETARAQALVARMDRTLRELAATRSARTVRVVAWSGAGSVPGRGTLTDAIIRAAGGENIAARYDDSRVSSFGIEELLLARPDAILRGEDRYDQPSLQESTVEHPVVRRAFRGRQIGYPASLYTCGLPQSADAVRQLRQALARLPAGGVSW